MRKLRLELDALIVETFAPAGGAGARGTVHGHVSLYWEDCLPSETCEGAGWPCGPSEQSCNGTCYENTCQPGGCGGGSAGCGGGSAGCASDGCSGPGGGEVGGPCSFECPEQFG
jgi:hypothetical protein